MRVFAICTGNIGNNHWENGTSMQGQRFRRYKNNTLTLYDGPASTRVRWMSWTWDGGSQLTQYAVPMRKSRQTLSKRLDMLSQCCFTVVPPSFSMHILFTGPLRNKASNIYVSRQSIPL